MTDAALVGDDLTLDAPPHAGPGEQVTDTARETLDPILHGVLELVAAAGEELDAVVLEGIAVTAAEVREGVNLVNLRESIAPTRERATLALRKDARHRMRRVLLRKA